MKRVYRLEGDICANCAAKIENKINRMDGVNKAKVSFLTLKFTLDAQDEHFDEVLSKSLGVFKTIEPSCEVLV